jgi:hypothetical protein
MQRSGVGESPPGRRPRASHNAALTETPGRELGADRGPTLCSNTRVAPPRHREDRGAAPAMVDVPRELAPMFCSSQPFVLEPCGTRTRLAHRLQELDDAGPILVDVWLRRKVLRDATAPRSALRIIRSTDTGRYAISSLMRFPNYSGQP